MYYWMTVLAVALVSSSATAKEADCVLWEEMKQIEGLREQSMILWIEKNCCSIFAVKISLLTYKLE